MDSETGRDVKLRPTVARNKDRGLNEVPRYDNRFTTQANQFPFLTSSRPADD